MKARETLAEKKTNPLAYESCELSSLPLLLAINLHLNSDGHATSSACSDWKEEIVEESDRVLKKAQTWVTEKAN